MKKRVITLLFMLAIVFPVAFFYSNKAYASEVLDGNLLIDNTQSTSVEAKVSQNLILQGQGSGGTGSYSYRFAQIHNGKWEVIQSFGTQSTCNWHATAPGDYTLEVAIADGTWSNIVYKQIQVNVPEIDGNISINTGTTVEPLTNVTITGQGTGGTGSYSYRFAQIHNGKWEVIQSFGTQSTCNWHAKAPGDYTLEVAIADGTWSNIVYKQIQVNVPELDGNISIDTATTVEPLTDVTITGKGTGGAGFYSYRFATIHNGKWEVIQSFGTQSTCKWHAKAPGDYTLEVAIADGTWSNIVYKQTTVNVPELDGNISINTDTTVNQLAHVTITGKGTGGAGFYSYRFAAIHNGKWEVIQSFGTQSTCDWQAKVPGEYTLEVAIADGTWSNIVYKQIQVNVPEIDGNISINTDTTVNQLAHVTITGQGTGGTGSYSYRFAQIFNGKWEIIQSFGTQSTCDWQAKVPGEYTLEVAITDSTWNKVVYKQIQVNVPELDGSESINTGDTIQSLTNVTITGQGTGGTGSYSYRFATIHNGKWEVIQSFGTQNTCNWHAMAPGDYTLEVAIADGTWSNIVYKSISIQVKPQGIDVSNHNGYIDWQQVKNSGVNFAMIRIGYGSDETDQDDLASAYNISECERLNIPYGVYLFSYARNDNEANSEAAHILRLLGGKHPALGVYLDVEDNSYWDSPEKGNFNPYTQKDQVNRDCKIVMDTLKANGYSGQTGIYANCNFLQNVLDSSLFTSNKLWLAQWDADSNEYPCAIWQCSGGSVPGISGDVDIDILFS